MPWRSIATPLYTHWRHGSASGVGEGCFSEREPQTSCCDDSAVFCNFNPILEQHLQQLHAQLRVGNRRVQAEIDR